MNNHSDNSDHNRPIYAKIAAVGSFLPDKVVTNDQLAEMVETSDQWIVERTGIHRRHLAGEQDTVLSMAIAAVQRCLTAAKASESPASTAIMAEPSSLSSSPAPFPNSLLDQIDLIIVATCSAEALFPSVACGVQYALGLHTRAIPALDINAACAGFVYALDLADQYIRNGRARAALVIGADRMSNMVDWQDRSTCVLFADGAAAALLVASPQPGVIKTILHADGQYAELLYTNWRPFTPITMQGQVVFKIAVNKLSESLEQLLDQTGVTKQELSWLVPHQANVRIIEAVAKRVGIPLDKIILTLADQGNTSAASVPLALDYGIRNGKIKRGDLLLLDAFGGGLTWGASLIKY